MFASLDVLEHVSFINTIRLRNLRACIMFSNAAAWNWLLNVVPEAIREIVYRRNHMGACVWLEDLLVSIRTSMVCRDPSRTFYPADYGLDLDIPCTVDIDLSAYKLPGDKDDNGWCLLFTKIVSDIMEVWLGYPSADKHRHRGVYVLNLVHTLGPEILYLDLVWAKYKDVDALTVRSTSMPESIVPTDFPILTPTSDLRKNVVQIARLIEDYVSGCRDQCDSSADLTSPVMSPVDRMKREVVKHRSKIFKNFVFDCFVVLVLHGTIADKKLQKELTKNPDKFSMFRECSPTRTNMLKDNGPFSPVYLWTDEGFFSALVCRGVTFGTPFSREGRTLFTSPKDFDAALEDCPAVRSSKSTTDYCDQGAYGRNNPGRKPDLVPRYWEKVFQTPRPGAINQAAPSFRTFYDFLQPKQSSRFPQIGPLTSYLLTVDYVYAGAVLPPDSKELGALIYELDKGPARALEYIGLGSPKPKEDQDRSEEDLNKLKSDFVDGFLQANALVKEAIPAEYHGIVRLDIFTTEHALCKFSRLRHLGIRLRAD